MPSRSIKILIADDHQLIREGLKRVLLGQAEVHSIGEAHDASQALDEVRKQKWDVVLLDINLPGRSGLEVLKEIKSQHPRLPVILLSIHPEEQFGIRGFRAGADGYLTKATMVPALLEAIHHVISGRKFFSPALASKLIDVIRAPANVPPHEALSDRENEVFLLISAGKTVGEIAVHLRLSVKTISTYRTIILRKLGLENNSQIMRYAHDHGLVR